MTQTQLEARQVEMYRGDTRQYRIIWEEDGCWRRDVTPPMSYLDCLRWLRDEENRVDSEDEYAGLTIGGEVMADGSTGRMPSYILWV